MLLRERCEKSITIRVIVTPKSKSLRASTPWRYYLECYQKRYVDSLSAEKIFKSHLVNRKCEKGLKERLLGGEISEEARYVEISRHDIPAHEFHVTIRNRFSLLWIIRPPARAKALISHVDENPSDRA